MSASAVGFLAAHGDPSLSVLAAMGDNVTKRGGEPRIESLRLQTGADLGKLKAFYDELLELPVLEESASALTIGAGVSRITFERSPDPSIQPYYHFAFNIPENKILSAREWQMARGPILDTPPRLRDPKFPDEIRHFRNWDAHSVFFLDPAGNVLEYIARHSLDNAALGAFSSKDILCVSEIAFVVDKVPDTASRIENAFGLRQYKSASDQFHAVGDENGLLLVFKRGRELGTGAGKPIKGDVFPTKATIWNKREGSLELENHPHQIAAKKS